MTFQQLSPIAIAGIVIILVAILVISTQGTQLDLPKELNFGTVLGALIILVTLYYILIGKMLIKPWHWAADLFSRRKHRKWITRSEYPLFFWAINIVMLVFGVALFMAGLEGPPA